MRTAIRRAAVAALMLIVLTGPVAAIEVTGRAGNGLDPFDAAMIHLMEKWDIPGASLAVSRNGRIVLAKGYGWANKERKEPVQPNSLFRLGSLSKVITAVAVLQLVEEGKLQLDEKVLPILGPLGPRPGAIRDPRVHNITVRHLLQHTAGFDRDKSGDPLFPPRAERAAARQGGPWPYTCEAILRDTLEDKLDFDPGARHAYSNVGYCILGRVIERRSGMTYEAFARQRIVEPAGATGLRLGRTLEPAPNEVRYYEYAGAPLVEPITGLGFKQNVARAYGGYNFEAMDALGQWIGSSIDFLRFMVAIDGQRSPALLKPETVRTMRARPSTQGETKAFYYALGVNVRPVTGGENWWHGGAQAGVRAWAARYASGSGWVAVFNSRPREGDFTGDIDKMLVAASQKVTVWPTADLFNEFR